VTKSSGTASTRPTCISAKETTEKECRREAELTAWREKDAKRHEQEYRKIWPRRTPVETAGRPHDALLG